MEHEKWIKALELKARDDGLNLHGDFALISESFADQVERHWKNRTEPTKFRWDEEWEKEYQSQAELALTFATELNASGKRWVDEVKEAAESFAEPVESEIARLLRGIRKVGERVRGALEGREAA